MQIMLHVFIICQLPGVKLSFDPQRLNQCSFIQYSSKKDKKIFACSATVSIRINSYFCFEP